MVSARYLTTEVHFKYEFEATTIAIISVDPVQTGSRPV